MPPIALLPVVASLVGIAAGVVALGFARTAGWEHYRSAAGSGLCASVYCAGDALIAFPSIGAYASLVASMQVMAMGGYIATLSRYQAAVAGPHPLGRIAHAVGLGVAALGILTLVPGLAFTPHPTYREIAWLGSSYTEVSALPLGQATLLLGLSSLSLPVARAFADMRRGQPAGRLHVLGFGAMLVTGALDLTTNMRQAPVPYVLSLGFIFSIACSARAVFDRFASQAADLDARTRALALLVDERTRELASAKDLLHRAEKLAALGQLAAGVAHEVNNPAAAVAANLTYVLEAHQRGGEFPPDAVPALQESLTAMGRVARIVRQLLDAGRAGARREVLGPVDLARVVESTLAVVRSLIPPHVRVTSTVGARVGVRAREDLLVQALVNLVTNAVQAVPLGKNGLVTISAKPIGRRVVLMVQDNGVGMSTEVSHRVFEPFFTTKEPGVGTGLGLSVTLGIIRSLGGEVAIESEAGVGTRVSVDLRADRPSLTPAIVARISSVPPVAMLRVLVVDDEIPVRDALRRMLKRTYEVRVAGGVDEALADLRARPDVDIVLCDVLMPDGGGERVYRTLQERSPELARRVVFLTGGAPDVARAFLESQPQPVLEKPIDAAGLASTIAKLRGEPQPAELGAQRVSHTAIGRAPAGRR